MTPVVCLGAGALDYPEGKGGGHTWVFLNWALGLRSLGCRVIWFESAPPRVSVDVTRERLTILRRFLEPHGFEEIALTSSNGEPPARPLAGDCMSCADAAAEADLLLDLAHDRSPTDVERFSRTAFVDIDPGQLQLWMEAGETSGAAYDRYFTIGETVGTARARFPDCGLTWLYTPPPVFLDEWAVAPSAPGAAYTTVIHLYAGTVEIDGQEFNNDKRTAFLDYLDLPSRTPQRLELALCLGTDDAEDGPLFERAGWRVRDAWDVTATPQDYATYIRSSRGEFSCAKPSCFLLQNAWISDRTICYLASGKPAVVQYTGPSRFLPDAEGLFRFRSVEEAAAMLEAAESEYERHCRAARTLTEEHFDARKVVARVLEQALP
jgi:hypothetical protein